MKDNLIELAKHLDDDHEIVSLVSLNNQISEMRDKTPFNYKGYWHNSEKMKKVFDEIDLLIEENIVKVDPTNIFKKYPLVEMFSNGYTYQSSKYIDHIVEYVKRIDMKSSEVEKHELKVV